MSAVAPSIFPARERYRPETAAPFAAFLGSAPSAPLAEALKPLVIEAAGRLSRYGLPTPLLERWKYTNLAAAVRERGADISQVTFKIDAPPGVHVRAMPEVLASEGVDFIQYLRKSFYPSERAYDRTLVDLNVLALMQGVVLDIPADLASSSPLMIDLSAEEGTLLPSFFFRLGKNARLVLIERQSGQGAYWKNTLTGFELGTGARLDHYRILSDGPQAVSTQTGHVRLQAGADYRLFNLVTGALLSRFELDVSLAGEGASCSLSGASLLQGQQHGDITLRVDHAVPRCTSAQYIRTILKDRAHGVFQGGVRVAQDAQKSDGRQLSNTLLLSDGADMNSCPELEIFADDVKCAHGATIGALDPEAMFYLRSRGIPEAAARGLLVGAFAADVFEKIEHPEIQAMFLSQTQEWLEKNLGVQG